MADVDKREAISPDELINHFTQQVQDQDPKYDATRAGYYRIDGWRQGRELSKEEFAGRILTEFPELGKAYRVSGVQGAQPTQPTQPLAAISGTKAGQPAKTQSPPSQFSPRSLLESQVINPAKEFYGGYMEGTGKMYNTLANIPMLAAKVAPQSSFGSGARGLEQILRDQGQRLQRQGQAAAPKATSLTTPLYKSLGGAIPTTATYLPAMAAGPAAPLVMGGISALEQSDKGLWPAIQAGVGGALAGKYLTIVNQVPGLKKLLLAGAPNMTIDVVQGIQSGQPIEQIMANMAASGTTMAALIGANPEMAQTAIAEAARLAAAGGRAAIRAAGPVGRAAVRAGAAWQEAIAPLPKSTVRYTPPPPGAGAAPDEGGAPPAAPSSVVSNTPPAEPGRNISLGMYSRPTANSPKSSAKPAEEVPAPPTDIRALFAQPSTQPPLAEPAPPAVPPKSPPGGLSVGQPPPTTTESVPHQQTGAESVPPPTTGPAAPAVAESGEPPYITALKAQLMAKGAAVIEELKDPTASFGWRPPRDPELRLGVNDFRNLYTVGRYYMQRQGASFEAWRGEMINQLGEWVDAHLRPMWDNLRGSITSATVQPGYTPEQRGVQLKEGGPIIPVTPTLLDQFRAMGPQQAQPAVAQPSASGATPAAGIGAAGVRRAPAYSAPPPPYRPVAVLGPEGGSPATQFSQEAGAVASRRAAQGGTPIYPQEQLPLPTEGLQAHGQEKAMVPHVPRTEPIPEAMLGPRSDLPPGDVTAQLLRVWKQQVAQGRERVALSGTGKRAVAEPTPLPTYPELLTPNAKPANVNYAILQDLKNTGFQPRNLGVRLHRDAPGERRARPEGGGRPPLSLARETPARQLLSGNLANEVWTKPVADGVIEVQRDSDTGEFEATKHYSDTGATSPPIRGSSPEEMVNYLDHVRQRELPIPTSQYVSRTAEGRGPQGTPRERPPAAADESGLTPEQQAAERQLGPTFGRAQTEPEMQELFSNISNRATEQANAPQDALAKEKVRKEKAAQKAKQGLNLPGSVPPEVSHDLRSQLLSAVRNRPEGISKLAPKLRTPEQTRLEQPEKNAAALSVINQAQLNRIIADATKDWTPEQKKSTGWTPTPAKTGRVQIPKESPFRVRDKGAGVYQVEGQFEDPAEAARVQNMFAGVADFSEGGPTSTAPPPGDAGVAKVVRTGVLIKKTPEGKYELHLATPEEPAAGEKAAPARESTKVGETFDTLAAAKLRGIEMALRLVEGTAPRATTATPPKLSKEQIGEKIATAARPPKGAAPATPSGLSAEQRRARIAELEKLLGPSAPAPPK